VRGSAGAACDQGVTVATQSVSVKVPLMPARLQEEWDIYHATWFTVMGVGGGVFLLSRLLGLASRLGI
jgi:hypothetical protein